METTLASIKHLKNSYWLPAQFPARGWKLRIGNLTPKCIVRKSCLLNSPQGDGNNKQSFHTYLSELVLPAQFPARGWKLVAIVKPSFGQIVACSIPRKGMETHYGHRCEESD